MMLSVEEHCRRRAVVPDEPNTDRSARGSANQAGTAIRAAAGKPAGESTAWGAAAPTGSRRAATAWRAAGQQAGWIAGART